MPRTRARRIEKPDWLAKGPAKKRNCFSGHALMENRHGLCVDLQIAPATGTAERETALAMLRRQACCGIRPRTPGDDTGYHCRDFVRQLSLAALKARDLPYIIVARLARIVRKLMVHRIPEAEWRT